MNKIAQDEDLKPWERQRGEQSKSFAAFQVYRDLGGARTLAKVADVFMRDGDKLSTANKKAAILSAKWHWVERCYAWDLYQDKIRQERVTNASVETAERHVQIASAFEAKVVQRLQSVDPAELSAAQMAKWFELAVKVKREALGMSSPIKVEAQVQTTINVEDKRAQARRIAEDPDLRRAALGLIHGVARRDEDAESSRESDTA